MNKKQREMKDRIQKVYRKPGGFQYIPENWPKTLWDLPTPEIVKYIEDRFDNTQNEIEYYMCLVYLTSGNKHDEILVEWKDSVNYKKFLNSLEDKDQESVVVESVEKDDIKVKKSSKKVSETNKNSTKSTIKNKKVDKKVIKNTSFSKNFI